MMTVDKSEIADPVVASALEKLGAAKGLVSVLTEEERGALIKMLDEFCRKEGITI